MQNATIVLMTITMVSLLLMSLLPSDVSYVHAFSTTTSGSTITPKTTWQLPIVMDSVFRTNTRTLSPLAAMGEGGAGTGGEERKKNPFAKGDKGRILVLGGSGFLGGTVSKRAILEGYSVTSLSRRGKPPPESTSSTPTDTTDTNRNDDSVLNSIDYRTGDARDKETILTILNDYADEENGGFVAVVHCIGLLFDGDSGIGNFNRFVSGSGSIPEDNSTYDDITRLTAFNAIEAAEEYASSRRREGMDDRPLPFVFTSAAEAGWPKVRGGSFVERTLAPEWLRRYLAAKRAVEARLLDGGGGGDGARLRPVIFRPSLIYSLDRVASLPPVGAFFVGNRLGLPFVDRPVTVQSLSFAVVRAIGDRGVSGVQRYMDIDELNKLGR